MPIINGGGNAINGLAYEHYDVGQATGEILSLSSKLKYITNSSRTLSLIFDGGVYPSTNTIYTDVIGVYNNTTVFLVKFKNEEKTIISLYAANKSEIATVNVSDLEVNVIG